MFDQQQRRLQAEASTGPNSLPVYMSPPSTANSVSSGSSAFYPTFNQLPPSYEEAAEKSSSSLPLGGHDLFSASARVSGSGSGASASGGLQGGLPSQEEVVRRTEAIT